MTEPNGLISALDGAQGRIDALAGQQSAGMPLPELVAARVAEASAMLRIMLAAEHKPYAHDADLLELWKALVKVATSPNGVTTGKAARASRPATKLMAARWSRISSVAADMGAP